MRKDLSGAAVEDPARGGLRPSAHRDREPAFGTLDGVKTQLFNPDAGLVRALDVIAPDYQKGGQDFIAGWDAQSGQFLPGFPALLSPTTKISSWPAASSVSAESIRFFDARRSSEVSLKVAI